MKLDNRLIDKALKCIKKERFIQGRVLDSVARGDYAQAAYLTEAYKEFAQETDKVAFEIIEQTKDASLDEVGTYINHYCVKKANQEKEDMDLGLCLAYLITNEVMLVRRNGTFDKNDSYMEEVNIAKHTLLVDRYLNSEKKSIKKRYLNLICTNIFRSNALRWTFRGNSQLNEFYNPDLYFSKLDHNILGNFLYEKTLAKSYMLLEQNTMATNVLVAAMLFGKQDVRSDIKALKMHDESEITEIAAVHACARDKGLQLSTPYEQYDEQTKNKILEGIALSEEYTKKYGKRRH